MCDVQRSNYTQQFFWVSAITFCENSCVSAAKWELQPPDVINKIEDNIRQYYMLLFRHLVLVTDVWHCVCVRPSVCVCDHQLGVKALTVEDLLQAQTEISAHNRQLKEQTKQLERDMALLRDHSLLLVGLWVTVVISTPVTTASSQVVHTG